MCGRRASGALCHETDAEWQKACAWRQREIELIRRLHTIAKRTKRKDGRDYIYSQFDREDLADRYELLADDLLEAGEEKAAIAALRASKRICKNDGVPFEGEKLLEYAMSLI